MKILILGGGGMLGHELARSFRGRHETWVTVRWSEEELRRRGVFRDGRCLPGVDAMDFEQVARAIRDCRPDAVLNCIGIVKQLPAAQNPIVSLTINALLPHRLADCCRQVGARLVLFSTDCVFSGRRGGYTETDVSDAEDLYGRTKFLGEVGDAPHVVTVRSSIIGRELGPAHHGLVDWLLSRRGGAVRGFRRAIYTGLTTVEMARVVEGILTAHRGLAGVWQVASAPITKYELLMLLSDRFRAGVTIEPDDDLVCDRSLNGSAFSTATGYRAPDWPAMVGELAAQPPPT